MQLHPERVVEEWLFHVPHTREARLFERFEDEVRLGDSFKEGRNLIEKTRPNAFFLSVVAQFNGPIAQKVVSWFRHLGIVSGIEDVGIRQYTMRRFLDGDHASEMANYIKRLDLGIQELSVEKAAQILKLESKRTPEKSQKRFQALQGVVPQTEFEPLFVRTKHPIYDREGKQAGDETFDLDENESEGTKKLFALAGPFIDTMKKGQVLIIDEFDARLHSLLTREIVSLFNSRQTNPRHAQLIFTAQGTNLLDNRFLRRDQIWFTEKDRQGATHLYSLAEYKVRNDASFERDYIQGRYGAIPYLGDLRQIVEGA
ncbi:MAG: ATP-binding protein [Proteobacteria bacterium]|nr:ATP-binding protein [Pseudomonadota bacterium]